MAETSPPDDPYERSPQDSQNVRDRSKGDPVGCNDEAEVREVLERYRRENPETLFGSVMVHEVREHSTVGTPPSAYDFIEQTD